jgi:hypothetical protein
MEAGVCHHGLWGSLFSALGIGHSKDHQEGRSREEKVSHSQKFKVIRSLKDALAGPG